jgi:hypothetical protein
MTAIKSITMIVVAAGTLVVTSCRGTGREVPVVRPTDQAGAVQSPLSDACSGEPAACELRARGYAQDQQFGLQTCPFWPPDCPKSL